MHQGVITKVSWRRKFSEHEAKGEYSSGEERKVARIFEACAPHNGPNGDISSSPNQAPPMVGAVHYGDRPLFM
jgi:hypothetical protein